MHIAVLSTDSRPVARDDQINCWTTQSVELLAHMDDPYASSRLTLYMMYHTGAYLCSFHFKCVAVCLWVCVSLCVCTLGTLQIMWSGYMDGKLKVTLPYQSVESLNMGTGDRPSGGQSHLTTNLLPLGVYCSIAYLLCKCTKFHSTTTLKNFFQIKPHYHDYSVKEVFI